MALHTLNELARIAGAELSGPSERSIAGTASLRDAELADVSFCTEKRFAPELAKTRAGAVLVPRDLEVERGDLALLRCDDVNRAFTRICAVFAAERPKPELGVHATAVVDATASVGANASIGPSCVVGPKAKLGANVVLHAGAVVGAECEVGDATELHANVVLYPLVRIGARCVLHAGAVVGSDGFGYEPPRELGAPWTKIPQSGTVIVEDDVELGANVAIDRARFGTTRIGRGAKLDNLIHVAHNCEIGAGSMFAAQVGVAGSTRVGRGVMLGGQVGLSGHIQLGDGVRVAAQSGVMRDVEPGVEIFGSPARPKREAFKIVAALERLPKLLERVNELEARVRELEAGRQELA